MICPRCGATAAPNKKFCGDCGTALPWQCSACGSDNPADKRFCGDCGASRGASSTAVAPVAFAAAPLPERRLLSVMFVDLVGSTGIGEKLDPEDFRDVISTFHTAVRAVVTRFGGFIARYMGDGVLAYFGYPQAHEADAERSIRAGLSIVEAVAALETLAGPAGTLRARVGIDTGFVVAGDLIGFGASREAAVVGDAPNLAARLQATAESGTVVVSDATRLLVGNLFECRKVELSGLKGRRGVEHAWVVAGESLIDSRYEALRRGQSSLVNRTEELDLMLRRWEQAQAGEGRVILLTGDPGIGKSRLTAALEECIDASAASLRFFCSPHHLDTPLHPVVRHIERAAKFQRGDSAATKWDKLTRTLPPGSPAEDKELIADLLSIPASAENLVSSLKPQQRKARTFEAINRQIDALARTKSRLILFEDIHWADPSTIELLHHLVETIRQLPVLLVVTARPDTRPAWAARPHVTVQPLSGLDRPMGLTLIKQITGKHELSQEVVDRIITQADNVPLFIEELTITVLKKIQDSASDARSPSTASLSIDAVPSSLQSSLMARLDRVSSGKEIAQIGAVIGREFPFELVQSLSGQAPDQLKDTLDELAQAEIIIPHGEPPLATYTFKHALVHDAAYASLLRDRRRALHLRVAEEMEKDAAGEPEPQLIAWHFAEAAAALKAIDHYEKAAERATGRYALAEMVNHLRNGLSQINHLPESTERDRRELGLQLTLGQALIDLEGGNSQAVLTTFERARELCFALGEVRLLPRVYDGLVINYHFIRANTETMTRYVGEMSEVHRRTGDPRALLLIRRAGSISSFLLGRFEAARDNMQKLIELYDAGSDGPQAGMTTRDPKAAMCTFLGVCLTMLGRPDSAAAQTLIGLQYAKALNHPVSLNLGLRRACVQSMLLRNPAQTIELSAALAALRAAYETYQGALEGTFFEDWAQLWKRPDPARFERVQNFLDHLDMSNIWAWLPFYMASTAELYGRYENVNAAVALLDRAHELINVTGARWCEAEVLRLRARFRTRDSDEAAALLRAGVESARQQGAKLWELRTAMDLAAVLRDRGNRPQAIEVLRPVFDWFTEGKDTADYVAARALLGELEERGRNG
jgi:class 3 adenylate cyclase/tetratricopeptide (TPR) repeat protein